MPTTPLLISLLGLAIMYGIGSIVGAVLVVAIGILFGMMWDTW